MDTIRDIVKQYFRTDLPELQVGDKIEIKYYSAVTAKNLNKNEKTKKDEKAKRLTRFKGIVIGEKNKGQISYTFSVLKDSKGSEKIAITSIFSYHSPLIADIKKIGEVNHRRAKLNYLERELAKKKDNE